MLNSSAPVLEIRNFWMRYPKSQEWTLEDLNMSITAGECLALVGSSGCGKSTLARVVMQILPNGSICRGYLSVLGEDPSQLNRENLRKLRGEAVGFVFQDPMTRLNPLLTIGAHLIDVLQAHKPDKKFTWIIGKSKELLERVGIGSDRFFAYPHELSGGMRQRLSIALAIALDPALVIADEPTTSLDVAIANQVMAELSKLCKELGSALLLISHDLALAARWCERINLLDQGKIVEAGSTKGFLQSPESLLGKRLVIAAREREQICVQPLIKPELILEVKQLRCWHALGGLPWQLTWLKAVNEVNFLLYAGQTLGVVGISGCGKSTLCRALMGLNPVRGGEVKLKGQNILSLKGNLLRKARRSLQMVFQDPCASLNPKMTIAEAVADPLLMHDLMSRSEAREKARTLLQQVGLHPVENFQNRFPNELSGGQLQRVAIARALSLEPSVLICDESVSMLDAEIQAEVLELLRDLQLRLKIAILFVTHDLSVATSFCHKVIVLDHGRVVEEGIGKKLLEAPQAAVTKSLVKACPQLPSLT